MNELTLWEYTAMVEEHNARAESVEEVVKPWTKEEYYRALEEYRELGDPSIQV